MPGTSFDRVAKTYDRTRGGQRRGSKFAAAISPWLTGERVVELGIGTGVIARGLADMGHDVVGFDLSAPMMSAAVDRLGARAGQADVDRLPLADNSVDAAYFVWVLHLVDDAATTLREAARVVRPGGRVVAVLANADDHSDDAIAAALSGLSSLRRSGRGLDPLIDDTPDVLSVEFEGFTPWDEFTSTPNGQADMVESRVFSSLFDVDHEVWESVVVPVIERLRAFPDPDVDYTRRNRHPLIVWSVN